MSIGFLQDGIRRNLLLDGKDESYKSIGNLVLSVGTNEFDLTTNPYETKLEMTFPICITEITSLKSDKRFKNMEHFHRNSMNNLVGGGGEL